MVNDVFANGREIACKKASGKSICAFPDVCWTPPDKVPPTPTGVPVPYPNTGMAKDCSNGSKEVKISGKEVMLKNKSHFKKSYGDEAGVAQLKGFMTRKNRGKIYFQMWSMDVKFQGLNVVRHFDIGTHNHGSDVGNTPPWLYVDEAFVKKVSVENCEAEFLRAWNDCRDGSGPLPPDNCDEKCVKAQACVLIPKHLDKDLCCSPANTGHHLVPVHSCKGIGKYNARKAPCVCSGGWYWHRNCKSGIPDKDKTHPAQHEHLDVMERRMIASLPYCQSRGKRKGLTRHHPWRYKHLRSIGISAHKKVFTKSNCSVKCLKNQLDQYHNSVGITDDTPLFAKNYGNMDHSTSRNSVQGWIERAKALTRGK